jgi:2'-5' RNA ligase
MSTLLALDVAILLPPDVRERAVRLSAALPGDSSQGLRLDDEHLPHITLTQQFVRLDELDAAFDRVDEVLRGHAPLTIHVTGGGKGGSTVWMAIERSDAIARLHESLMKALQGLERPHGSASAFFAGDARIGDVVWVTGYRLKASLGSYTPHVTLGQAKERPTIEPFSFQATLVAACHLGRFCTCRRVLRSWELTG